MQGCQRQVREVRNAGREARLNSNGGAALDLQRAAIILSLDVFPRFKIVVSIKSIEVINYSLDQVNQCGTRQLKDQLPYVRKRGRRSKERTGSHQISPAARMLTHLAFETIT